MQPLIGFVLDATGTASWPTACAWYDFAAFQRGFSLDARVGRGLARSLFAFARETYCRQTQWTAMTGLAGHSPRAASAGVQSPSGVWRKTREARDTTARRPRRPSATRAGRGPAPAPVFPASAARCMLVLLTPTWRSSTREQGERVLEVVVHFARDRAPRRRTPRAPARSSSGVGWRWIATSVPPRGASAAASGATGATDLCRPCARTSGGRSRAPRDAGPRARAERLEALASSASMRSGSGATRSDGGVRVAPASTSGRSPASSSTS